MPEKTIPHTPDLCGKRILVVEDDFYLASDTGRILREAGAQVIGPLPRSSLALDALAGGGLDAAVVDINLGEGPLFDLADGLKSAGVPFVFLTGYERVMIPPRLADVAVIQKPTDRAAILEGVASLLSATPPIK
ncbi:hypothetical protein [Caulobacter flavus]|uniref:hypothetical protein n=1 Tax=Caulobacter flavus TaxID=1679497 RepID=UPI0015DF3D28|nr:hypothetical protein [Caulobacter flavus]